MAHTKFVAHIRKSDGAEQTVKDHLEKTAARARAFILPSINFVCFCMNPNIYL
jgi:hypothetical protein